MNQGTENRMCKAPAGNAVRTFLPWGRASPLGRAWQELRLVLGLQQNRAEKACSGHSPPRGLSGLSIPSISPRYSVKTRSQGEGLGELG